MTPMLSTRQRRHPRGPLNDLHQAVRDGSVRRTIELLWRGSLDIDKRDEQGKTPLMIAAEAGRSSIVRILLNKGAYSSVIAADNRGFTALHGATYGGHLAVTTLLLEAGADPDALTTTWCTPVLLAADRGHREVIEALLKAGADPQLSPFTQPTLRCLVEAGADLQAAHRDGFTPLHLAAQNGHLEAVTTLVSFGADVHASVSEGYVSLFLAAIEGHAEVVRKLVASGADLQATTSDGTTPLMAAAQMGHVELVREMLDAGADLCAAAAEGHTTLHYAVQGGQTEVVRALLKAGAEPEAMTCLGFTPVHVAAPKEDSELLTALIDAGANPRTPLPGGDTPLHMAAKRGNLDGVRVLLRAGGHATLPVTACPSGWKQRSPLEYAAFEGHLEVVRELVRQVGIKGCGGVSGGVDALCFAAQEPDVDVMTALIEGGVEDTGAALIASARSGSKAAVQLLLQQQQQQQQQQKEGKSADGAAYVNTRDEFGRTPLFLAASFARCSPRVVRLLVDAGADTESTVRVAVTPPDDGCDCSPRVVRLLGTDTVPATVRAANIPDGDAPSFCPSDVRLLDDTGGETTSPVPVHEKPEDGGAVSDETPWTLPTAAFAPRRWRGETPRKSSCTGWRAPAACCCARGLLARPRGCGPIMMQTMPPPSAVLRRSLREGTAWPLQHR